MKDAPPRFRGPVLDHGLIDWCCTAEHLRCGGALLVGDTPLATGPLLRTFLLREASARSSAAGPDPPGQSDFRYSIRSSRSCALRPRSNVPS